VANYILPPPIGQSNDLYEAFPQAPDTVIPGNTINNPGVTNNLSGSTLFNGIQGSTLSAPAATSTPNTAQAIPLNIGTISPTQYGSGPQAGSLADYFARAIIIVLGFIFVAIGLNMLRPGTVALPKRV